MLFLHLNNSYSSRQIHDVSNPMDLRLTLLCFPGMGQWPFNCTETKENNINSFKFSFESEKIDIKDELLNCLCDSKLFTTSWQKLFLGLKLTNTLICCTMDKPNWTRGYKKTKDVICVFIDFGPSKAHYSAIWI